MRLSDFLEGVGHPVAYYPALAEPLGGVNAAILFGQIWYWLKRSSHELGVHKTMTELAGETGLSRTEQESARKALRRCGVLKETHKRLEHKVYFHLDLERLEQLMEGRAPINEASAGGSDAPALANAENLHSRMQESCIRESGKPASGNDEKPHPRSGKSCIREAGNPAFVNGVKTTTEITLENKSSSNAREPEAVDNSAAAAADSKKPDKPGGEAGGIAPHGAEAELLAALRALPRTAYDAGADRLTVLTWVGKGVVASELAQAHQRALKRRDAKSCDKPVGVKFLDCFVSEVLAARPPEAGGTEDWWLGSETQVCNEGYRLGARPKKQDESLPAYRVIVAKAAGKGPWIDFVLKDMQRANSQQFTRYVIETLGEALLPVDWYAS